MNDSSLLGERTREHYRRLVRERGPDAGREIDRLKHRSRDGAAEALLEAYERGAIPAEASCELSTRSGTAGHTLFMVAVSAVGGDDVAGA